jgi:uncharacterized protein (DUF302 family)
MADNGRISVASAQAVGETVDRLVKLVEARGLNVFARVDHAGGAAKAGMELRPTQLLIFGNAKGGTPLMQDQQIAGIDLPLKALVWEDADGNVWLTYNDPAWIAQRHGLGATSAKAVEAMSAVLAQLSAAAVSKD